MSSSLNSVVFACVHSFLLFPTRQFEMVIANAMLRLAFVDDSFPSGNLALEEFVCGNMCVFQSVLPRPVHCEVSATERNTALIEPAETIDMRRAVRCYDVRPKIMPESPQHNLEFPRFLGLVCHHHTSLHLSFRPASFGSPIPASTSLPSAPTYGYIWTTAGRRTYT